MGIKNQVYDNWFEQLSSQDFPDDIIMELKARIDDGIIIDQSVINEILAKEDSDDGKD